MKPIISSPRCCNRSRRPKLPVAATSRERQKWPARKDRPLVPEHPEAPQGGQDEVRKKNIWPGRRVKNQMLVSRGWLPTFFRCRHVKPALLFDLRETGH